MGEEQPAHGADHVFRELRALWRGMLHASKEFLFVGAVVALMSLLHWIIHEHGNGWWIDAYSTIHVWTVTLLTCLFCLAMIVRVAARNYKEIVSEIRGFRSSEPRQIALWVMLIAVICDFAYSIYIFCLMQALQHCVDKFGIIPTAGKTIILLFQYTSLTAFALVSVKAVLRIGLSLFKGVLK